MRFIFSLFLMVLLSESAIGQISLRGKYDEIKKPFINKVLVFINDDTIKVKRPRPLYGSPLKAGTLTISYSESNKGKAILRDTIFGGIKLQIEDQDTTAVELDKGMSVTYSVLVLPAEQQEDGGLNYKFYNIKFEIIPEDRPKFGLASIELYRDNVQKAITAALLKLELSLTASDSILDQTFFAEFETNGGILQPRDARKELTLNRSGEQITIKDSLRFAITDTTARKGDHDVEVTGRLIITSNDKDTVYISPDQQLSLPAIGNEVDQDGDPFAFLNNSVPLWSLLIAFFPFLLMLLIFIRRKPKPLPPSWIDLEQVNEENIANHLFDEPAMDDEHQKQLNETEKKLEPKLSVLRSKILELKNKQQVFLEELKEAMAEAELPEEYQNGHIRDQLVFVLNELKQNKIDITELKEEEEKKNRRIAKLEGQLADLKKQLADLKAQAEAPPELSPEVKADNNPPEELVTETPDQVEAPPPPSIEDAVIQFKIAEEQIQSIYDNMSPDGTFYHKFRLLLEGGNEARGLKGIIGKLEEENSAQVFTDGLFRETMGIFYRLSAYPNINGLETVYKEQRIDPELVAGAYMELKSFLTEEWGLTPIEPGIGANKFAEQDGLKAAQGEGEIYTMGTNTYAGLINALPDGTIYDLKDLGFKTAGIIELPMSWAWSEINYKSW